MVLTTAVLGALTAALVTLGFKKIEERQDKEGNTIIFGEKADGQRVQIVKFRNDALRSPQYDLVTLSSNATNRPNTPTYTIKNDGSGIKKVFTIAIVPDTAMKANGVAQINLNGAKFFPITPVQAGMFTNVSALNVPIPESFGLKIEESKSLDFFLWSPSGATVSCLFAVFVGNQD